MSMSSEELVTGKHGGVRSGAGRKPKPRPVFVTSDPPSGIGKVSASVLDHSEVRSALAEQKRSRRSRLIERRLRAKSTAMSLPEVCPNAAGIDIGSTVIFVAVPEDRAQPNVRSFPTFTEDLQSLADWLSSCGIENVAMEATGVYWISLFQILEKRGFNVTLVNARHMKNVPGRKSDVKDCRWIQFLHAVGLLQASFRPPDAVCALRSYMRHRDKLVAVSSSHVLRMQKALSQMNIQLHNVLSDITGVSGLAILDSILEGEYDPEILAELCHPGVKADNETIRKSLVGDWRSEHLFALDQELRAYRFCQGLIKECDAKMDELLAGFAASVEAPVTDVPKPKVRKNASLKTAREKSLTEALSKLFGTDLTRVPGLGVESVYRLFTELGDELTAFATGQHLSSYLGLCPDNRVSGGKVLSAKTRHVPSRAATIFRLAANSLERSKTQLGEYLRKMKSRLGKQEGITATAHKLARIFYTLVTTGQEYDENKLMPSNKQQERRKNYLIREAAKLGLTITNPVP